MRELTIYQLWFTNADCYKSGVRQTQRGVQVHSTGANNPWLHRYVQPDDGRLGKNKYGNHSNKAGSNVCASAYIGKLENGKAAVYQVLPWDMRCWLSGSGNAGNANRLGYIGFEVCEDGLTDRAYFNEVVLGLAVNLCAYLCQLMGQQPDTVLGRYNGHDRYTVSDHAELHAAGVGSGHADISHWLKKFGFSMNDFRGMVRSAMMEGVRVTYIDALNGTKGDDDVNANKVIWSKNNGYVNVRDNPNGTSLAMLRPGSKCEADETKGEWTHVVIDGWVKNEFLKG